MKKIELVEDCFGPDVRIDGESLFIHEYDNRNTEEIQKLQESVINELKLNLSKLDMEDWKTISHILAMRSSDFEYDNENSHSGGCNTCGNYNSLLIYGRKNETKS
jgi:hypothetical protein